jgi:hypothetical protein
LVHVLPDYLFDLIEPNILAAALNVMGFDNRDLGQDADSSDLLAAIQAVEGVDWIEIKVFDTIDETDATNLLTGTSIKKGTGTRRRNHIPGKTARFHKGDFHPAQLIFLSPDVPQTLQITEAKE